MRFVTSPSSLPRRTLEKPEEGKTKRRKRHGNPTGIGGGETVRGTGCGWVGGSARDRVCGCVWKSLPSLRPSIRPCFLASAAIGFESAPTPPRDSALRSSPSQSAHRSCLHRRQHGGTVEEPGEHEGEGCPEPSEDEPEPGEGDELHVVIFVQVQREVRSDWQHQASDGRDAERWVSLVRHRLADGDPAPAARRGSGEAWQGSPLGGCWSRRVCGS